MQHLSRRKSRLGYFCGIGARIPVTPLPTKGAIRRGSPPAQDAFLSMKHTLRLRGHGGAYGHRAAEHHGLGRLGFRHHRGDHVTAALAGNRGIGHHQARSAARRAQTVTPYGLVAIGALPDRGFGTPRHCWCTLSLPQFSCVARSTAFLLALRRPAENRHQNAVHQRPSPTIGDISQSIRLLPCGDRTGGLGRSEWKVVIPLWLRIGKAGNGH